MWPPVMDRANLPKHRDQMKHLLEGRSSRPRSTPATCMPQGLLVPLAGTIKMVRRDNAPTTSCSTCAQASPRAPTRAPKARAEARAGETKRRPVPLTSASVGAVMGSKQMYCSAGILPAS